MSRRAQTCGDLLLHNPTAGAAHPNADELMRQLKAAGFRPKYQSSKEDYRQTLRKRWDLVIVAGGDGTVARVARRLRNRDIPLAILPIGTANNIARALGLNGDIEALISHLRRAKPKRLDIGVARGPWGKRRFLEAVGFGTIAKAIAHSGPAAKALRIDMGREALQKYFEEAEGRALRDRRRRRGVCRRVFAGRDHKSRPGPDRRCRSPSPQSLTTGCWTSFLSLRTIGRRCWHG